MCLTFSLGLCLFVGFFCSFFDLFSSPYVHWVLLSLVGVGACVVFVVSYCKALRCLYRDYSPNTYTQNGNTLETLTEQEQNYVEQVLESERQQWRQALYTISLETSDKTFKGLCEKKITEIETIQQKIKGATK